MFYPRTILLQLEKELETKEALVLTGMRQSGKTAILRHLLPQIKSTNKAFFDLEDPINRKLFEGENFEAIWANLAPFGLKKTERAYIFLDEIQNLPIIPSVVKYFVDHFQTKFFLSGSSSFYLKNLFAESMSGRKLIFELFPLTFKEFLVFKNQKRIEIDNYLDKEKNKNEISWQILTPFLNEYLEFGGLPAVVLESDQTRKRQLLREIFTSYFEKDVKTLGDFGEITKLRDLILLLIPRVSGQVDITTISKELGVSRETVYNYLSFLEKTYFITLVSKFSKSLRVQAAGNQKIYFGDLGILNVLGKMGSGQILEQGIFQILRPENAISYYRNGPTELDCILNKEVGLEIKETGSNRDVYFSKKIANRLKLKNLFVVSKNFSRDNGIVLASDL